MISREEILKGQQCPPGLEINLGELLKALNQFRTVYGKPMIVNSGYRTPEHNKAVGGAPNSAHCLCMAADFSDKDKSLTGWIYANIQVLIDNDLWMEHPDFTPGWVHLQKRRAKTRVFFP